MELEAKLVKRYSYVLLQNGMLPLAPDGTYDQSLEHRCTSVLIWPEDEQPFTSNTVLTDPCFTSQGFLYATEQLEQRSLSFLDIGRIFVTHRHRDHLPNLSYFIGRTRFKNFRTGATKALSSIVIVPYPGHAPTLRGLVFCSSSHQKVGVVGDAVLDIDWLKAWGYYWPNGYQPREIVQTWESVAQILLHTDLIIPGHGRPISVTASLVKELLSTFPSAEHANECQGVEQVLSNRLERLLAEE
jgi:glyoxylase-like metal-dependent hydrolase (beta-lactamase superfamily II)